jgi:hypothetical protein
MEPDRLRLPGMAGLTSCTWFICDLENQHSGVSEISGPCPHLGPETPFLAAKMLDAYS